MKYGTYLYNFDLTYWFDTEDEAEAYGRSSGFQYVVVERLETGVGYNWENTIVQLLEKSIVTLHNQVTGINGPLYVNFFRALYRFL